MQHPLTGLWELADVHCSYQHNGTTVNASTVWKVNFAVMQSPIHQDLNMILDWINCIEKSIQGLILA